MNSSFPGMDPFLELHWGDVHSRLITYLSDALQPHLPDDLRARIEERVFVESDLGHSRLVIPGVRVFESTHRQGGLNSGGTAIAELTDVEATEVEPFVFNLHGLEITEGFIEIRERGGGRVVTVIEILSRANKFPGPGQEMYRQKQDEVLQSNASLVEIDLVRGGPTSVGSTDVRHSPATPPRLSGVHQPRLEALAASPVRAAAHETTPRHPHPLARDRPAGATATPAADRSRLRTRRLRRHRLHAGTRPAIDHR